MHFGVCDKQLVLSTANFTPQERQYTSAICDQFQLTIKDNTLTEQVFGHFSRVNYSIKEFKKVS